MSNEIIEFAEDRLKEEFRNGRDSNVQYWAAYLDGARAMLRKCSANPNEFG